MTQPEEGDPESIGMKIRLKRRRLDLTLRQLAGILKTDPSNLQGWESGRHQPTKKSLALITEFPLVLGRLQSLIFLRLRGVCPVLHVLHVDSVVALSLGMA